MQVEREPVNPGEESVWDYPRPPRVEPVPERIRIRFGGRVIADTTRAKRVLETSHPPVYYIPLDDISADVLEPAPGASLCEWKGIARYWTVRSGEHVADRVAWSYADPPIPFASIRDHVAFYCAPMDACFVGDEKARPQPGGFYGGWVTSRVKGPFKGTPGTEWW